MKQLTLRGFDDRLKDRLEALARERSISLNKAALLLMRRGAGLAAEDGVVSGGGATPIGSGLDRFIGVWSADDEREFLESIASLDKAEPELWESQGREDTVREQVRRYYAGSSE